MDFFLKDTEIAELIKEEKHVSESLNDFYKMKEKKGHREYEIIFQGLIKVFSK